MVSSTLKKLGSSTAAFWKRVSASSAVKGAAIAVGLTASQMALAQVALPTQQLNSLCVVPQILKYVVGVVAIGAVVLWGIAHMNSKNELSDLTIKIGVPCVVVSFAAYLISAFGLSVSCSGIS
jgi:hypothetical protein